MLVYKTKQVRSCFEACVEGVGDLRVGPNGDVDAKQDAQKRARL